MPDITITFNDFNFEVICSKCKDNKMLPEQVIHFLISKNSELLEPKIVDNYYDYYSIQTKDENLFISVEIFPIMISGATSLDDSAFLVKVASKDLNTIETFRLKLLEDLHNQFEYISVVLDEVSNYHATKIYSLINEAENYLRYIIQLVFIRIMGPDYLEKGGVISNTILGEAKSKKKVNMTHYKDLIDKKLVNNDINMLDFNHLGDIISNYGVNMLSTRVKEISQKIIDDNYKHISDLKKELNPGELQGFLNEYFIQKGFKNLWNNLNSIRNTVAHNGFFAQSHYDDCDKYFSQFMAIHKDAESAFRKLNLSDDEINKLQETLVDLSTLDESLEYNSEDESSEVDKTDDNEINADTGVSIDRETFIKKLKNVEDSLSGGFVGLRRFINRELLPYNYSLSSIREQIDSLIEDGIIEKYYVDNLPDKMFLVAALKLLK